MLAGAAVGVVGQRHSNFYYRYIHGDKDTFHLAFRRVLKTYAMPSKGIHRLDFTMCQHDFDGERIFQHRNRAKWALWRRNPRIGHFWHEEECMRAMDDLRRRWSGKIPVGEAVVGQGIVRAAS